MAESKVEPIQIKSFFDNSEFPSPDEIDLSQYYEVEIEFEDKVQVAWTFYFMKKDNTQVAYRIGKEKCNPTPVAAVSSTEIATKDKEIATKDKEIAEKNEEITKLKEAKLKDVSKQTTENIASSLANGFISSATTNVSTTRIINEINETKAKLEEQIKSLQTQNEKYIQLNNELQSLIEQLTSGQITGQITEQITSQLSENLTKILQQNENSVKTNEATALELVEAKKIITKLETATQEKENECNAKLEAAEQAKAECDKKLTEAEKAKADSEAKAKEEAEKTVAAEAKVEEAEQALAEAKAEAEKAKQEKETAVNTASDALIKANNENKSELEKVKQECEDKLNKLKTESQQQPESTVVPQPESTVVPQPESKVVPQPESKVELKPAQSLTDIFTKDYINTLTANNLDEQLKKPIDEWIKYYKLIVSTDNDIDVTKPPFKEISEKLQTLIKKSKDTKIPEVLVWIQKFGSNKSNNKHLTSEEYSKAVKKEIELKGLKNSLSQLKTRTLTTINDQSTAFFDLLTTTKSTLETELKSKHTELVNLKKSKKIDTSQSVEKKESKIQLITDGLNWIKAQINTYNTYKTDNIDPYITEITNIKPDDIAKLPNYETEFNTNTNTINTKKQPILDKLKQFEDEFSKKFPKSVSKTKTRGGSSRKAKPRKSKSITFRAYS